MLVLTKNGAKAVNLDNIKYIYKSSVHSNHLCVVYVGSGESLLGKFDSAEKACKVLADILDAYEKGAKVYRIEQGAFPDDDY